ncbi:MAG: homoserine kinase [Syntrophomonadaceae bacterium]|nr:homoserine kinase [Syntrophomonadaceae bacterium]MDD3024334.1 homoserine kinase [Syntrophomonadaceae bacterium]
MFTVKVPATSANLGPGFDTLGLALNLFLQVDVNLSGHTNKIIWQGEGKDTIVEQIDNNLLLAAMNKVFQEAEIDIPGLSLTIMNDIPIGKGLGSSAAAITAGLLAANKILQERFSNHDLLKWAVQMEGHADNVVPAFNGGLTTSMLHDGEVYFQKINFPADIDLVLVVPDFEVPTEKSRQLLPQTIDLQDMVSNLQRACYILASVSNGDFRYLDKAMDDVIFQPVRQRSIPGFKQVLQKAKDAGALGAAISGSGPSLIAITREKDKVGRAMQKAFSQYGVESHLFFLKACGQGAKVE